jgi:hypothetical protein
MAIPDRVENDRLLRSETIRDGASSLLDGERLGWHFEGAALVKIDKSGLVSGNIPGDPDDGTTDREGHANDDRVVIVPVEVIEDEVSEQRERPCGGSAGFPDGPGFLSEHICRQPREPVLDLAIH